MYTAIECFQKNSQLADELGDQNCCALAYANLGHAHFMLEEYEPASQYYEKVELENFLPFGYFSLISEIAYCQIGGGQTIYEKSFH